MRIKIPCNTKTFDLLINIGTKINGKEEAYIMSPLFGVKGMPPIRGENSPLPVECVCN